MGHSHAGRIACWPFRIRLLLALTVPSSLLLAACSSPGTSTLATIGNSARSTDTASGNATTPGQHDSRPGELLLSCDGNADDSFHVTPTGSLVVLPDSDTARQQALTTYVRQWSQDFTGLLPPTQKWVLLNLTDSTALYGAVQFDHVSNKLALVEMKRTSGSQWVYWSSSSGCSYLGPYRPGLLVADWQLTDPVKSDDATVEVRVGALACTSGNPSAGGILPPQITQTASSVKVTFFTKPLPSGGYTCQGVPGAPYTVKLGRPLGSRTLLNGDAYPPSPATVGSEMP